MQAFFEVIVRFPAIIFTVALLVSLGYWIVATVLGGDGFDADADIDIDIETGLPGDLLSALGLHLMPVGLVVTIISLVGWLTSVIGLVVLDGWGAANVVTGLGLFIAALVIGVLASGRVARLVGPLFAPNKGSQHADLLGRICTVQTGRVDLEFGQAEVTDADGGSYIIQIRCGTNSLSSGDPALLVDVDDGVFTISPDVGELA